MQRIRVLIVIFFSVEVLKCFIASINCADQEPPIDDVERNQRSHYYKADKARIMKIFYETAAGEWGHKKRMKDRWDELQGREMPQTGHNLYKLAVKWIKNGDAEKLLSEQERQCSNSYYPRKKIRWTPEMKENVLKFYLESEPEKWKQSKRLKELWDNEYPEHSDVKGNTLMVQVRHLLKNHSEEFNMKRINLTEGEKIDLMRCYHKSCKYKNEKWKIMRELFIKKHPQHAKIKVSNLRYRVLFIRQNNPEIEDKILGRVSGFDRGHSLRESGETSGLKRVESTSVPTTQADHSHGASEIRETSSSGHNVFPDVDTSHQIIYADVVTSQQTIYPNKTWIQDATPHVGTNHQAIDSKQRHSTKKQRESSKGKETVLN